MSIDACTEMMQPGAALSSVFLKPHDSEKGPTKDPLRSYWVDVNETPENRSAIAAFLHGGSVEAGEFWQETPLHYLMRKEEEMLAEEGGPKDTVYFVDQPPKEEGPVSKKIGWRTANGRAFIGSGAKDLVNDGSKISKAVQNELNSCKKCGGKGGCINLSRCPQNNKPAIKINLAQLEDDYSRVDIFHQGRRNHWH